MQVQGVGFVGSNSLVGFVGSNSSPLFRLFSPCTRTVLTPQAMPYAVLTPEEANVTLRAMEPDLAFVLEDNGVSELGRASLGRVVKTLAQFKNLADDRTQWRTLMREEFKIDDSDGLAGKAEISAVISAWEAAEAWKATKDKADADDRLMGRARTLKPNDFTKTRLSFEALYGQVDDMYVPARAFVEVLQQQLEEGEFRADSLSEMPSITECEGEPELTPTMSKDGIVKFRRTAKIGNLQPGSPEQLRRRLRILGNAYMFVKLRHPAHAVLRSTAPEVWLDYCDYILSPRVAAVEIKDDMGRAVGAPPWHLVCSYEHQIRRKMCWHINTAGLDIKQALKMACTDPELKQEHFTTPMAVSVRYLPPRGDGMSRSSVPSGSADNRPVKNKLKAKDRKAGKGGSKGSGKAKPSGIKFKIKGPDGTLICYAFNNSGERCKGDCGKLHICQVCDGPDNAHPYHKCKVYQDAIARS